jgi:hypothetical protein
MNEFTRKAMELVDDLLEVRAMYHAGRGHWSHAEAARSALLAHLEGVEQKRRTPSQYFKAHQYLREREADLGAGELDHLLSIFGLPTDAASLGEQHDR